MFVIAQPGWLGFDAAFMPSLEQILAAPYQFNSCYVGGTHDQRALGLELARRGRPVSWNYERSETAWTGGYSAGRAQAINALDQLHEIGWADDTPVIYSPYDSTVTNYQVGYSFARGVIDVHNGIPAGFYGDHLFLQSLSQQVWIPDDTVFWQWMNNGPTLAYATIRQTGHGTWAGAAIDIDLVKKPVPMWTGPGKEPDMANQVDTLAYVSVDMFTVYAVMIDGTIRHITGPEFAARGRTLADVHQINQAELDAWPVYQPNQGSGHANGTFNITGTVTGGGTVS